jgi:hypothetical protein
MAIRAVVALNQPSAVTDGKGQLIGRLCLRLKRQCGRDHATEECHALHVRELGKGDLLTAARRTGLRVTSNEPLADKATGSASLLPFRNEAEMAFPVLVALFLAAPAQESVVPPPPRIPLPRPVANAPMAALSTSFAQSPEARARQIENSINRVVLVADAPDSTFTIVERMKYWHVPGISIARQLESDGRLRARQHRRGSSGKSDAPGVAA